MIAIGLGEIAGSMGNGAIHDKIGTKKFCLVNIVEIIVAYTLLIAYIANDTYNVPFASAFTFAWGF
jgi:predicted MFS family arabinose efflux permease